MRQPVHRRQNPTPASTEGPFYPDQLPIRRDNDLVTIVDGGQPASGKILYLAGLSQNKADFLFNRLQGHRAHEGASVRQIPAPELDPNVLKGSFDIVLG